MNRVALGDFGRRALAAQAEWCKERDKEEEALILELQCAQEDIEVKGEVSQELKQKLFTAKPGLEAVWPALEKHIEEMHVPLKQWRESSPKERASAVAVCIQIVVVKFLKLMGEFRAASILEISIAPHIIPNSKVLDKILRYETATDRSLSRALDRLERLQRRRKGEPVPPPMSVRLTVSV